jgi:hypothetical protein
MRFDVAFQHVRTNYRLTIGIADPPPRQVINAGSVWNLSPIAIVVLLQQFSHRTGTEYRDAAAEERDRCEVQRGRDTIAEYELTSSSVCIGRWNSTRSSDPDR